MFSTSEQVVNTDGECVKVGTTSIVARNSVHVIPVPWFLFLMNSYGNRNQFC